MCCQSKQNKEREPAAVRVVVVEILEKKQSRGRRGGDQQSPRDVRQVSEEVNAGSSAKQLCKTARTSMCTTLGTLMTGTL